MDNTEASVLLKTDLPLPLFIRGKVRDSYDLGDRLLIIATDRISAFDVILPNGIPDKGLVLNQLSAFWFRQTAALAPNHLECIVDDLTNIGRVVLPIDPYIVTDESHRWFIFRIGYEDLLLSPRQ